VSDHAPSPPVPRALAAAFKAARADLQRRLEPFGVHAAQDYLLEALSEHDRVSVGELAERLRVEVPTVVRMVGRMQAAGLVDRVRDEHDRRRSLIVLTERGRAVAPAAREALADASHAATRGFSAAERAQLLDLLERVRANLRHD
jgi:DNA-binding MarR family transcriptional regulator